MSWLNDSEAVQQLSHNIILYDLAQIRGSNAVLSRIPNSVSGVYAWYRGFRIDPNAREDPELFVNFILDELSKVHSAPREARLPPAHKIVLQAETSFSKQLLLKELAADVSFRQLLFMLLNNSLIFQQPLYIGKANNIYARIHGHLREGSILRERLNTSGHSINQCRLLLIYTSHITSNLYSHISDRENYLDNESIEECELSEIVSERLVEDILSRLFLPSFSLTYG